MEKTPGKGFLWVNTPKTASTSLEKFFKENLTCEFITNPKWYPGFDGLSMLRGVVQEWAVNARMAKYLFTFTVVRNPWDKVVSVYHQFTEKRDTLRGFSFKEFVQMPFEEMDGPLYRHACNYWDYLALDGSIDWINRIFKFEEGDDFTELAPVAQLDRATDF